MAAAVPQLRADQPEHGRAREGDRGPDQAEVEEPGQVGGLRGRDVLASYRGAAAPAAATRVDSPSRARRWYGLPGSPSCCRTASVWCVPAAAGSPDRASSSTCAARRRLRGLTGHLDDVFIAALGALFAANSPGGDSPGQDVAHEEIQDGPPHRLEEERDDGRDAQEDDAEDDLIHTVQIVDPGIEQRRTDEEAQDADPGEGGDQGREPVQRRAPSDRGDRWRQSGLRTSSPSDSSAALRESRPEATRSPARAWQCNHRQSP